MSFSADSFVTGQKSQAASGAETPRPGQLFIRQGWTCPCCLSTDDFRKLAALLLQDLIELAGKFITVIAADAGRAAGFDAG